MDLRAAAGARYGPGHEGAGRWAALRRAGGDECGGATRHIAERRDWMRYDEYLARSLLIGSGWVEAHPMCPMCSRGWCL